MLFRSSVLVVCLLGWAVVQGFTYQLNFQGKNPLRDTRVMNEDMTWEEAISSYDAKASEIVSVIPLCEDFVIFFKDHYFGGAENDPDYAQDIISRLPSVLSIFSAELEKHILTGSSEYDNYCFTHP